MYILNVLAGLSQLINAIVGGNPNEMLSARAYRQNISFLVVILDIIFFFDQNHCKKAFEFELKNEQLPEYEGLTL